MARPITQKNIKIHTEIDGVNIVRDSKVCVSFKTLKALSAKKEF